MNTVLLVAIGILAYIVVSQIFRVYELIRDIDGNTDKNRKEKTKLPVSYLSYSCWHYLEYSFTAWRFIGLWLYHRRRLYMARHLTL